MGAFVLQSGAYRRIEERGSVKDLAESDNTYRYIK